MLGFSGKKVVEPPKIKDWVLAEMKKMIPEPEPDLTDFYLASIRRLEKWAGPLAVRKGCPLGLTLVEVNVLLGLHAMQILEASNFRAWTRARNLTMFQKVTFQRSLVVGAALGLESHYYTKPHENRRWEPFSEDAETLFDGGAPKQFQSKIFLAPMRVEQAVFQYLFPDAVAGYGDAMAGLAAIDSFESPPDPENPIVSSIRRALRKTMLRYSIRPTFEGQKWLMSWHPALLVDLASNGLEEIEGDESGDAPDQEEGAQDGSGERGDQRTRPEEVARIERTQKGARPSNKIAQAMQIAAMIKTGLHEGALMASCPKAPFHGFRGIPCLVWPGGVRTLAHHLGAITPDNLAEMFVEQGWVVMKDGEPEPQNLVFTGSKGGKKVKKASAPMVPLSDAGADILLPSGGIPDNTSVALPEEIQG